MSGRRLLPLLLLAFALFARTAAARPLHLPDSDGDGLPDEWELHGVALESVTGLQWIDLPAMGADARRPDIFLQIDWMAGAEHDQRPSPEALRLIVEAFARAPYVSPTGSVGITLHVDAGPNSVLTAQRSWGALSRARALPWQKNLGTAASGTYDWTAFDAIRNAPGGFVETGRASIFHYAIFAHYHDLDDPHGWGASGNSRGIGGTDLLVTLGNFTRGVGTAREQAGTLMHELGHNLGLRHGGCDDTNLKPGYESVMNYAYQMEGVSRGGMRDVIDFSRGAAPVLDDVLLDEPPTLLANGPADTKAGSCVARGEVRAGITIRPALPPAASKAAASDGCGDGTAFDDWKNIRLDLGGIGKTRTARR